MQTSSHPLAPRAVALAVSLALAFPSFAALAETPQALVGKYQMEVQGGDVLELRADGTAAMAGEETRWSATVDTLTIGPDTMQYQYDGARLLLAMGTVQLSWKRLGPPAKLSPMQRAAAKAKSPGQATPDSAKPTAQPPPGAGASQDAQARQLLQSTAWCSFTYNQHTGTSTTQRVVFRPDGVMTVSGGGETYNSGPSGTVAGQSSSGGAYRWKVEGLRLYLDGGQGAGFQDVGLTAERNSSGSPILHSQGREYAMCQ